jgi:hypothetical protein
MKKRHRVWLLCALAAGCASDGEPPETVCDPSTQACTLRHDFGAYALGAGVEIDGVCMSWTVGNEADLWVQAVRTENDGYFHHSNWFFVPESTLAEPDGHWDCWKVGFSEVDAAIAGGVLYAQSTQSRGEEQRFTTGAAVRIPARSRIVAYTHLLNAGAAAARTAMRLELDTVPRGEVTAELAPFRLNYNDLKIPPKTHAEFEGRCDVRATHATAVGGPFRLRLYYLLPHFHGLGTGFTLGVHGGAHDGETLFRLEAAYGDPLGHTFPEPVDLAALGADGLWFRCAYDNPRDAEVGYGIGDQEMCVMLGFSDSGMLFDGLVSSTETLEPSAKGVLGRGACAVVGIPYPLGG